MSKNGAPRNTFRTSHGIWKLGNDTESASDFDSSQR